MPHTSNQLRPSSPSGLELQPNRLALQQDDCKHAHSAFVGPTHVLACRQPHIVQHSQKHAFVTANLPSLCSSWLSGVELHIQLTCVAIQGWIVPGHACMWGRTACLATSMIDNATTAQTTTSNT